LRIAGDSSTHIVIRNQRASFDSSKRSIRDVDVQRHASVLKVRTKKVAVLLLHDRGIARLSLRYHRSHE
jgi:hypothetical protein